MVVLIHRGNRRQAWDCLRLVRESFAEESQALERGWRKARSGALLVREAPAGLECCLPRRPAFQAQNQWVPAEQYIRWGTVTALELALATEAVEPGRWNGEGAILA